MKINFICDKDHKLKPSTVADKKSFDALRMKAKEGTRYTFEIFKDRSTVQHRFLWSIYAYSIFASEKIAHKYPKTTDLHAALKWMFCMERPHLFVTIPVYIDGKKTTAKVPFSESPVNGIDSVTMNEYTTFAIQQIADVMGIHAMVLQSESKKHADGTDE